jgi:hypothetical protein
MTSKSGFDRIFIESDRKIADLTENGTRFLSVNDLWSPDAAAA